MGWMVWYVRQYLELERQKYKICNNKKKGWAERDTNMYCSEKYVHLAGTITQVTCGGYAHLIIAPRKSRPYQMPT